MDVLCFLCVNCLFVFPLTLPTFSYTQTVNPVFRKLVFLLATKVYLSCLIKYQKFKPVLYRSMFSFSNILKITNLLQTNLPYCESNHIAANCFTLL